MKVGEESYYEVISKDEDKGVKHFVLRRTHGPKSRGEDLAYALTGYATYLPYTEGDLGEDFTLTIDTY